MTDTVGNRGQKYSLRDIRHADHIRVTGQAVETAPAESVATGPAEILSNVDGDQVQRFAIRIDRVDADAKNGRNLLITVTDEALLAKTGGIVQGMSGSPILQNGRLVGAVTHVLVNSPATGLWHSHRQNAASRRGIKADPAFLRGKPGQYLGCI